MGDDQLCESVNAARREVKGLIRHCRATLAFLTDLDEKLAAAESAQPNERHSENGNSHQTAHGRVRLIA